MNQHQTLLEGVPEAAIAGAFIGALLGLPPVVRALHRRYGRRADIAMWSVLGVFVIWFFFAGAIVDGLRLAHIIGPRVDRLGRVW